MTPTRKYCTSPHHQGPRWVLALNFHVKVWDEEKVVPKYLQSRCIACQRIGDRLRVRTKKLVDVGPFRQWLLKWHSYPGNHWTTLANAVGADESRLRRIANATPYKVYNGSKEYIYSEGQKSVSLDFVDRCLLAAGGETMIWELYDVH